MSLLRRGLLCVVAVPVNNLWLRHCCRCSWTLLIYEVDTSEKHLDAQKTEHERKVIVNRGERKRKVPREQCHSVVLPHLLPPSDFYQLTQRSV